MSTGVPLLKKYKMQKRWLGWHKISKIGNPCQPSTTFSLSLDWCKSFPKIEKKNHEKDPTTSYHEMPMMQACNVQASIEQDVSKTHFQRTICSFFAYFLNGILLPKLFWPTVRKYCSSDRKNFWNSRLKAENFQIFWDH